ncbi:MAG TPA: hypothetical protein VHG91_05695 [Longimicrobium sp.]|nr:hypothetical protein [Longimicrobium sp.]
MRKAYIGCALTGLFVLLAACQDHQPVSPNLLQPLADSIRVCGAEGEGSCILEPISGTVDPRKPVDDEGGEDGGGDDGGGGDVGGGGGSGGGSGGGGGALPDDPFPGDTVPSDTACRATGDTLVDKTQVQDAFSTVWAGSNAEARDQWTRRERGGWIVKTATGYAFQEFTDWRSEACAMVPMSAAALDSPANAVAWVHSHPFELDEIQMSCKRIDRSTGLVTVPTYRGVPSRDDVRVGDEINARRSVRGLGKIDGFVIDKDGIQRFMPLGLEGGRFDYAAIDRCAY